MSRLRRTAGLEAAPPRWVGSAAAMTSRRSATFTATGRRRLRVGVTSLQQLVIFASAVADLFRRVCLDLFELRFLNDQLSCQRVDARSRFCQGELGFLLP